MTHKEYVHHLKFQSDAISYENGLRFALVICGALYPDYVKFHNVYHWGNPDLLQEAIELCRKAAAQVPNNIEITAMMEAVDAVTPDMDDFGSELGSYALNASAAVYETLQYIQNQNNVHVYDIGTYYTDTIDFRIQEERTLTDQEIEQHPVMQQAWKFVLEQCR